MADIHLGYHTQKKCDAVYSRFKELADAIATEEVTRRMEPMQKLQQQFETTWREGVAKDDKIESLTQQLAAGGTVEAPVDPKSTQMRTLLAEIMKVDRIDAEFRNRIREAIA